MSLTIDVGSPEIEARATSIVVRATLGADDTSNSLDKGVVEGDAHEDGLREGRRMTELPRSGEVDTGAQGNTVLQAAKISCQT